MKSRTKEYFGFIAILVSICFAFIRGEKQGKLECIDFNILPIIANSITVIICLSLMILGILLIKKGTK